MSKEVACFRVDAGGHIGSGHVMRCLTLAHILKKKFKIEFICRDFTNNLVARIKQQGFAVHLLEKPEDKISKIEDYRNWLGVPLEAEINQATQVISKIKGLRLLVVDHYSLDKIWQRSVQKYADKIMVIDDLANRPHACDVLLDHNIKQDHNLAYKGLYPQGAKSLFGPKYALINESFFLQRKLKKINKVKSALVFLGGMDANDYVNKVVTELMEFDSLRFYIVPGQMTNMNLLQEKIANRENFVILKFVENMASLYSKIDFCIGSSGVAAIERGVQGVPTIDLLVAENQRNCARQLKKNNLAICLFDRFQNEVGLIHSTVLKICSNVSILNSLRENCLAFFPRKRYDFLRLLENLK